MHAQADSPAPPKSRFNEPRPKDHAPPHHSAARVLQQAHLRLPIAPRLHPPTRACAPVPTRARVLTAAVLLTHWWSHALR